MLILDGENPVAGLAFTPDATRLVITRAHPWKSEVWPTEVRTLATGETLSIPHPGEVLRAAIHPSGRFAFFAHNSPLSVTDLSDGTVRAVGSSEVVSDVIVSPDGTRVIARTNDGFQSFRCAPDASTCALDWTDGQAVPYERLAGFLDNDRFVTVGSWRIVTRDAATGEARSETRYPTDNAISPTISPDRSRLAVRGTTQFYVYGTANWKVQAKLATETRPYIRFAYHPTRPILAAITRGQTLVKFLDADNLSVAQKFNWRLGEMKAVCFSADGTLCAAGGMNGKVVVWDVDE